jgi:cyclase
MLAKRIIACLDVHQGRTVKGTQFIDLRDAGDPAELAIKHAAGGADEIVLLDISATVESRPTLLQTVSRTAEQLFIPFCVGGGIRNLDDAARVLEHGADKVSINSSAVARPELITEIAARFGSQAVVVAIDARRSGKATNVVVNGGRKESGRTLLEWAREAEERGAGEILLTCMQQDGMKQGFDCESTAELAETVHIPVIASGGAGSPQHFVDVFTKGKADAALAASIFHFGEFTIGDIKSALAHARIPVRQSC